MQSTLTSSQCSYTTRRNFAMHSRSPLASNSSHQETVQEGKVQGARAQGDRIQGGSVKAHQQEAAHQERAQGGMGVTGYWGPGYRKYRAC